MPFLFEVALGGVAFSFLSSLAVVARDARTPKTAYEEWLIEIDAINVIKDRA